MPAPDLSTCPHARGQRRLIDRHFSRRITPRGELLMRSHLPGCDSCRRYYERHMVLAAALPAGPRMADRLAAGLGIAAKGLPTPTTASSSWRRSGRFGLLVGTAAAACVALLIVRNADRPQDEEFAVRGAGVVQELPQLEVYRVAAEGAAGRPAAWMAPTDELAFSYRNPNGFTRLMVFGIDDGHQVYWFHPAWTDIADDPIGVSIRAGTGPFELPEAIAHDVQGPRLRIVALFANEPVSVRQVEARVRAGAPDPAGTVRVESVVEVRR